MDLVISTGTLRVLGGDNENGDDQIVSVILLALVQVSVSAYLLVSHSPDLSFSGESVVCAASFQQRLHAHLYNTLLLAVLVILYLRHSQELYNTDQITYQIPWEAITYKDIPQGAKFPLRYNIFLSGNLS